MTKRQREKKIGYWGIYFIKYMGDSYDERSFK